MAQAGNSRAEADRRISRALWYLGDGRIDLRDSAIAGPGPGEVEMRTRFSGVSRGTERLVLHGRVPESEWARMRAPRQDGAFPGPVKYGYCAVAEVVRGPDVLLGRTAFCLNPHEDRFCAPVDSLRVLPGTLPPRRAVLAANMETALNAIWDSGAGPCDRCVVVGAGVVGLLAAWLLARSANAEVTVIDVKPGRRDLAEAFGCRFAGPAEAPRDADVVIHASASASGLATALGTGGDEATVVEMSWHGADATPVPLGGAFHARRLKLISSQVGQVSPSRRPRWTLARRMDAALGLLASDDRLDRLIDHEIAFEDAPARLPGLLAPDADVLGIVIAYG